MHPYAKKTFGSFLQEDLDKYVQSRISNRKNLGECFASLSWSIHVESETFYLFAEIEEALDLNNAWEFLYYNQQLKTIRKRKESQTNLTETDLSF